MNSFIFLLAVTLSWFSEWRRPVVWRRFLVRWGFLSWTSRFLGCAHRRFPTIGAVILNNFKSFGQYKDIACFVYTLSNLMQRITCFTMVRAILRATPRATVEFTVFAVAVLCKRGRTLLCTAKVLRMRMVKLYCADVLLRVAGHHWSNIHVRGSWMCHYSRFFHI